MLPRHAPPAPVVDGVLMCPPEAFEVLDEKNDFMRGQQGRVDRARAAAQWRALADTYRDEGLRVVTLPALPAAEDMVFCANPSALVPGDDGAPRALLARKRHPSRQAEVAAHAAFWRARGVATVELPHDAGHFEGHGDLLRVPGRRFALLGVGGRSEARALPHLRAAVPGLELLPLPLVGRPFYHLDTALCLLDDETALLHPPAFHADARATLERCFPRLLPCDADEAASGFACNSHALPGGRVLVPAQSPRTAALLEREGFTPRAVDVDEFHRSGGSVFCMKLELTSAVG